MLRRVAIGAALAGALIATVSAAAAGPADEADQQRAVLEDLQAGEEQALVDLFAADSALGRAEAPRPEARGAPRGRARAGRRDGAQPGDLAVQPAGRAQAPLRAHRAVVPHGRDRRDRDHPGQRLPAPTSSTSSTPSSACRRGTPRSCAGTRDFAAETKERQRSLRDQEQQVEQLVTAARAEADRLAAARGGEGGAGGGPAPTGVAHVVAHRPPRPGRAGGGGRAPRRSRRSRPRAAAARRPPIRRAPATATRAARPPHRPRHRRRPRRTRPAASRSPSPRRRTPSTARRRAACRRRTACAPRTRASSPWARASRCPATARAWRATRARPSSATPSTCGSRSSPRRRPGAPVRHHHHPRLTVPGRPAR